MSVDLFEYTQKLVEAGVATPEQGEEITQWMLAAGRTEVEDEIGEPVVPGNRPGTWKRAG